MDVRKFSIEEAISFGWKTTTKNIVFIIILFVIFLLISMISQAVTRMTSGNFLFVAIVTVISWVINAILTMGIVKIALRFCDNQKPAFEDLYSSYPLALKYIGALILFWIICGVGLILLIIPGIILMLKLQFFTYFIIDKNKGPLKALEASWEATKGNELNLLGLWFVFLGVAILGILALVVGLFVAIPVIMIAMAFVYRKLADGITPEKAVPSSFRKAKPSAAEKPSAIAAVKKEPGAITMKLDKRTLLIASGGLALVIAAAFIVRGCAESSQKTKAIYKATMIKQAAAVKAVEEAQANIARIQAEEAAAAKARPPVLTMADAQRFDALQNEWAQNLDEAGDAISKYDFTTCDTYIDKCLNLIDSMKQVIDGKIVNERLVTARLKAIETMTIAYANTNEILAITKNPTTKDQDWPELMKLSLETIEHFNKAAELFDYSDASGVGDTCRKMKASIETLVQEIKQKSGGKIS